MNKILYIVLGIVVVIFLSLTGYYYYSTGSVPIPVLNSVSKGGVIPWQTAKKDVVADCKLNNFPDDSPDPKYILRLLNSAKPGFTFNPRTNTFDSANTVNFDLKGINSCYFVWIGDATDPNLGVVSYESKSGSIKQLSVSGYQGPTAEPQVEETAPPEVSPSP